MNETLFARCGTGFLKTKPFNHEKRYENYESFYSREAAKDENSLPFKNLSPK